MTNYTPKKPNFLRQLFARNSNINEFNNDVQQAIEDKILLNYYSSLAMHHPDSIVVFSPEGEVLSQNKNSIKRSMGFLPKNKSDYQSLVPTEAQPILDFAFKNALKGKSERHETVVENKQGQVIYVFLTFIPIKRAKNDVEGVYLIIEDITKHKKLTHTLELSERHLLHAQEIAKVGSWEYSISEDKLYCSDYFYEIFGFDKTDEVPMNKPFQYVHPDDYKLAYQLVNRAVSTGTSYVSEFRIYQGKTNEIHYIRVQADAIWKDNKPDRIVGVIRDYTQQKRLEIELETTNNNLRNIFDNLNVGFWMRESIDGKITFASKGLEGILQIPLTKLYEKPDCWKDMILPGHRNEVFDKFKLLLVGKRIQIKYRIKSGDGKTKWVLEQTIPRVDNEGRITHLFGMVADITAEVEMQEQLNYYATHDILTTLPNQRSLYGKLEAICGNDKNRFAILYLDLDRFNVINNSLGHQIGDEVLKMTANRLISVLSNGGYIARLSSNDFIIIIDDDFSNKEAIYTLAEKIIARIDEPLKVKDYELHVTTSIGISFFPEDGDNKLTLLENAYSALYHAKQQGKNNYQLYSFSKGITSYKKYVLEKDMRKAIANEAFELYYQPQVEPRTGIIKGAEALIRWNHDEWGVVSPGEFIPLAEENHLIHHISDWVIKKACSQLREWKDKGYTLLPISINISPIRFLKKGLVELVKLQLQLFQIPAKYLELEITESSLLRSQDNVHATLAGLKELGVKIALDDFGTGYASLNYLREFQVDTIKIDQVFIRNIDGQNKKDAAIVSSVLHLAKGLDIKVVAEGVEEHSQFEFLKQKECDLIQGYLYSKPVPLETFEEMMQTGYLKPRRQKVNKAPETDRRKYYRFEFPYSVLGEMTILEVNKRKVDLGSAEILIGDISLGGIKVLSSLRLPINSNLKFRFNFKLLNEVFEIEGALVWRNEGRGSTFYYGIMFEISEIDADHLAGIINKMTVLRNLNREIPDTDFIQEEAYLYLRKNGL